VVKNKTKQNLNQGLGTW